MLVTTLGQAKEKVALVRGIDASHYSGPSKRKGGTGTRYRC